jgi:uncharacterized membrane protein
MESRSAGQLAVAAAVTALAIVVMDLTFLGVIAKSFYDSALGPLRRPVVVWQAALLFYLLYVVAVVWYAELGAATVGAAALRGAGLGLVAYGTYELTNWAVIQGWPARLVPVDWGWGIVLTACAAAAGRAALRWFFKS